MSSRPQAKPKPKNKDPDQDSLRSLYPPEYPHASSTSNQTTIRPPWFSLGRHGKKRNEFPVSSSALNRSGHTPIPEYSTDHAPVNPVLVTPPASDSTLDQPSSSPVVKASVSTSAAVTAPTAFTTPASPALIKPQATRQEYLPPYSKTAPKLSRVIAPRPPKYVKEAPDSSSSEDFQHPDSFF